MDLEKDALDVELATGSIKIDQGEPVEPLSDDSASDDLASAEDSRYMGKTIAGRYKIVEFLGAGGMGEVYKACHVTLAKTVAVKILKTTLADEQRALLRFDHEAKAAGKLHNDHIAVASDYGLTEDNRPFLVMDYVNGDSLSDMIKTDGVVDPQRVIDIFIQVCDAMTHAHESGIIHRDLKPGNIIVSKDSRGGDFVQIVDFGIAKIVDVEGEATSQNLTQTGEIFGSPLYMSPEQCVGKKVDARSDIYSVGCTMFEALVGRAPFVGANPVQTIFGHVNDPVPSMKQTCPDVSVPAGLETVVAHCLQKDAADRYQTMEDVRRELERVKRGQQPTKKSVKRILPRVSPFHVFGAIGGLLTLALIAAIAWFAWIAPTLYPWQALRGNGVAQLQHRNTENGVMLLRQARDMALSKHASAGDQVDIWSSLGDGYIQLANESEQHSVKDAYLRKAAACFDSALQLERSIKDEFQLGHLAERLGEMHFCLGEYQKAEAELDEAMIHRRNSPGPDNYFITCTGMKQANNYFHEGKYKESKQAMTESLAILKKMGPDQLPYVMEALLRIGADDYWLGQYQACDKAYAEAESIAEKISSPDLPKLRAAMNWHVKALKQLGRTEDAERLQKKLTSMMQNEQ